MSLRNPLLTVHIAASVGWLGAVAAFIVLDVATVASRDEHVLRAAYIAMHWVTVWSIVPLAAGALVTGVGVSLASKWGLFRHYWVVVSLVLTVVATLVLLVQLPLIAHRAAVAPHAGPEELERLGHLLPHSVGGFVVLLAITGLNVYKPRGLTKHWWRNQERTR